MLLIKIVPVGGQSSYKAEVNMMLFYWTAADSFYTLFTYIC